MVQHQQTSSISVENNFLGGLKTEFTGLNFPENACTATENCVFSLIGDVTRRLGIDYETNYNLKSISNSEQAISSYKWNNAGGDGSTQIVVLQVGGTLYFFESSSATISAPLSTTQLASTVTLSQFSPSGDPTPNATECTYADGNGYLFVFHPYLEPFYCSLVSGVVTPNLITVQNRDFGGILEPGVADNLRPGGASVTQPHAYNLNNQGWVGGTQQGWSMTTSTAIVIGAVGTNMTFPGVQSGVSGVSVGQGLTITGTDVISGLVSLGATVVSYGGTTLIVTVNSVYPPGTVGVGAAGWTISFAGTGSQRGIFQAALGVWPSNADVWWTFKDNTDVFNPSATVSNITLGSGPAPKGYYILNSFQQQRSSVSGLPGLPDVTTLIRPRTGTWFQGRVFYTGVDAGTISTNSLASISYTWTENIYFSQIVNDVSQFGKCYQINDPTSETLFDILPTDGGIITIQGCGSIYKLFPIQQGILVFAANGVWFITGNSGIGFTATDYAIVKISGIRSISGLSFVDVNGYPMFWNEEGIYYASPTPSGSGNRTNEMMGIQVQPMTLGTILSFYNSIPLQSKKYARASYDPITYVVKWVYKSTNEIDITSRYQFDSVLNFNTVNKAFYPYAISGTPKISGLIYVVGPGGSTSPDPVFKYITSVNTNSITFAEENNANYLDWQSFDGIGVNFSSFFITGYRIPGQAMVRFQSQYIKMYSRNSTPSPRYIIQALWDSAVLSNSGKWSTQQVIIDNNNQFGNLVRRIKLRGHGEALQIKVSSVQGYPFDIIGWVMIDDMDAGI